MINTLNESSLHRTLKSYYAAQHEGSATESPVGSYIADILTAEGDVIEIQTASLAHLAPKARAFLEQGRMLTIVHPLVTTKYIETYNCASGQTTRRKSPQHKGIYAIFRELTTLTPYLLDERFTLDIVEVSIAEARHTTAEPVQSGNGRRRVKKSWLKDDKQLLSIGTIRTFHGSAPYLVLLPASLPPAFSAKDVHAALIAEKQKVSRNEVNLMLWLYLRLGLVSRMADRGRAYIYTLKK